jgi:hypothetical protein
MNLKDRIEDDDIVKENFANIFARSKKNSNKEVIEELEKKFYAGEKPDVKPRAKKEPVKKKGTKRNYNKMRSDDSESVSVSSEVLSQNNNIMPKRQPSRRKNKGRMIIEDSEDEES